MASRTQPHQLQQLNRHQLRNYYSNPAFCQKSEYYASADPGGNRRALSPTRSERSARQSPLGAQTTVHNEVSPLRGGKIRVDDDDDGNDEYEQEFYEEMLVDDSGYVQEKKIVVISSPQKDTAQERAGSRYAPVVLDDRYHHQKQQQQQQQQKKETRYEYVPVEDTPSSCMHRYALISNDEDEIESNQKSGGRYSLVPLEQMQSASRNRYAVVTDDKTRYEYIKDERQEEVQSLNRNNASRWEEEPSPVATQVVTRTNVQRRESYRQTYQPKYAPTGVHGNQAEPSRRANPIATQKLHELLKSPKRAVKSPTTPRKVNQINQNIVLSNSPQRGYSRVHQQLRYQNGYESVAKKTTAIVQPMQSVYGDAATLGKADSWPNLKKPALHGTLAVAALMMCLCGGVTTGLCFYMISVMGKLYFLEFGIVSGAACFLLGILGFRSRYCYWLPNRNYISGYIVLSIFSLITCGALLVMLIMQPKPGSPLADMTSGAVCGISVLSLLLAFGGIVASYCCKHPPPDNRVQHCERGFTV